MVELDQELRRARESADESVRLLENREEREPYNRLAEGFDSIRVFFVIFSEDPAAADLPTAEISCKEFPAALERVLAQLISPQENRYWVSICDVLEYEIVPILESWPELAERTCEHID